MDASIITIHCSQIHKSPTAHVSTKMFPSTFPYSHLAKLYIFQILGLPKVPKCLIQCSKLSCDSGEVLISGWSGWWFDPRCEMFSLLDGEILARQVGSQEPIHIDVGSKRHHAPNGYLSKVGLIGSIHVELPNVGCLIIQETILAKEWSYFHLAWKIIDYLHLKDLLKYECNLYLKQPMTSPLGNIIVAYRTSNYKLGIEIGQRLTIPISRYNRLCNFFFSYITFENDHNPCRVVPYITSLEIHLHHYFENVVLGNLKCCFQSDHKVDINLHLTEATTSATLRNKPVGTS